MSNTHYKLVPYMGDKLAAEYTNWLIAEARQKILDYGKSKKTYEARNILERWELGRYNFGQEMSLKQLSEADFTKKMRAEFLEKKIVEEDVVDDLISSIILAKPGKAIFGKITVTKDSVKCGRFIKFVGPERLAVLLGLSSPENILISALRYASISSGSQQWNIPRAIYELFVKKYGLQVEGFASPFNSQIIMFGAKHVLGFCSLFPAVDVPFGSLGNFFNYDFVGKIATFNPPYTMSIMEGAANKALETCENAQKKAESTRIFITMPYWEDAECIQKLLKCKCLETAIILKAKEHYYEDSANSGGKPIIATFPSILYVLSVGFGPNSNKYEDLVEAWKPA